MLKISTIVPVYNAVEDVKKCLDSLVKNYDFSNELIIIDDYSNEETQSFLQLFIHNTPPIQLIRNNENLGYLKTCNHAISQASGDIVILLNSDTMIPPDFCAKIEKCFASDNNIGIACPLLSNTGHKELLLPLPKGKNIEDINHLLDTQHTPSYPKLCSCNGSCFCVRKEVFAKIGLLDEIYGKGYYEETDFCYRAQEAGYQCNLIDNLYIHHKWHASFSSKEREKLSKKNEKIFLSRWDGFEKNWYKENKRFDVNQLYLKLFKRKALLIQNTPYRLKIYMFGIRIFSYKKSPKQTV